MGTLTFVTSPLWLPDGETVEVRPVCDGVDILGQIDRDAIGLYPPDFFAQSALSSGGMLRLGICQCGSEGCADREVEVTHQEGDIYWWSRHTGVLKKWSFDIATYKRAVSLASEDLSWERTADTIYRLLKLEDYSAVLKQGWQFEGGYLMDDGSGVNLCFNVANGAPQTIAITCPTYEPELAIAAVRAYMDMHFAN